MLQQRELINFKIDLVDFTKEFKNIYKLFGFNSDYILRIYQVIDNNAYINIWRSDYGSSGYTTRLIWNYKYRSIKFLNKTKPQFKEFIYNVFFTPDYRLTTEEEKNELIVDRDKIKYLDFLYIKEDQKYIWSIGKEISFNSFHQHFRFSDDLKLKYEYIVYKQNLKWNYVKLNVYDPIKPHLKSISIEFKWNNRFIIVNSIVCIGVSWDYKDVILSVFLFDKSFQKNPKIKVFSVLGNHCIKHFQDTIDITTDKNLHLDLIPLITGYL